MKTPSTQSILFLGSQMAIGGAQRLLLQQAQWFQAHGYRVTAAFMYDKEGFETQWRENYQVPLVNLRAREASAGWVKNAWLLAGGLWRAWKLMRSGQFDAIETFTHHSNFLVFVAWMAGIPLRVASHQGHILGFPRWLERVHAFVVNRFATCMVAVSDRIRLESLREGVRAEKIRVVHNGTTLPHLHGFDRDAFRQALGIPPQSILVLSVGRLTDQKAHTYLVQAAAQIIGARDLDVRFAIAGDGPLRDALQSEIHHYGLESVFHLLGARGDIPQLLAAADIFALSSRWEGLPVALLEAMGMGLPAVSTTVEGVVEVISPGENGLLVPLENPAALAEALDTLLDNPSYRKRLGNAGQVHVREVYSLERMCQRMQALLDPQAVQPASAAATNSQ